MVYFGKLPKGGEPHIRLILGGGGDNKKTRVAVYDQGL